MSWEVKRAGDNSYNGVYTEAGVFAGQPYYTYGTGGGTRYLYYAAPVWVLSDELDGFDYAYYSASSSLPGNPWSIDTGSSPAPLVNPSGSSSKNLTLTNVSANCDAIAACSGASAANNMSAIEASEDVEPGSTAVTITLGNKSTGRGVHYQSKPGEPGETDWPSGQWTVELNVTTANANINWIGTYICRVNSSCVSQATVGSLTGQSISLGTTGIKVMHVDGASQEASETDTIYVVLVFTNTGTGIQSFEYTPDGYLYLPPGWAAEPESDTQSSTNTINIFGNSSSNVIKQIALSGSEFKATGSSLSVFGLDDLDIDSQLSLSAEDSNISESDIDIFSNDTVGAEKDINIFGLNIYDILTDISLFSLDEGSGESGIELWAESPEISGTGYWSITGTWADIFGIPVESNVTHIRFGGIDTRCVTYSGATVLRYSNNLEGNSNGLYCDALDSGTELWSGREVLDAEAGWITAPSGEDVSIASNKMDATANIELRLYVSGSFESEYDVQLNHDNLIVEIEYLSADHKVVSKAVAIFGAETFVLNNSIDLFGQSSSLAIRDIVSFAADSENIERFVELFGGSYEYASLVMELWSRDPISAIRYIALSGADEDAQSRALSLIAKEISQSEHTIELSSVDYDSIIRSLVLWGSEGVTIERAIELWGVPPELYEDIYRTINIFAEDEKVALRVISLFASLGMSAESVIELYSQTTGDASALIDMYGLSESDSLNVFELLSSDKEDVGRLLDLYGIDLAYAINGIALYAFESDTVNVEFDIFAGDIVDIYTQFELWAELPEYLQQVRNLIILYGISAEVELYTISLMASADIDIDNVLQLYASSGNIIDELLELWGVDNKYKEPLLELFAIEDIKVDKHFEIYGNEIFDLTAQFELWGVQPEYLESIFRSIYLYVEQESSVEVPISIFGAVFEAISHSIELYSEQTESTIKGLELWGYAELIAIIRRRINPGVSDGINTRLL